MVRCPPSYCKAFSRIYRDGKCILAAKEAGSIRVLGQELRGTKLGSHSCQKSNVANLARCYQE